MDDWREVFDRRRRQRRNLLLLCVLVAGIAGVVFVTARQSARERSRDTLQLQQLKVNWGEFRGYGESQGDQEVTLWFDVVLIEGPQVEAHLLQPNSAGRYATLFRDGRVRALPRAKLDAALVGHTVTTTLRARE